jgi:hypothetical protein
VTSGATNRPSVARVIAEGALRCATGCLGLTVLIAVTVWAAGLPQHARELLGFGFSGPSEGTRAGLEIALHNAQLATVALTGAVLAPRIGALAIGFDLLLGALLALNAAVVGVALGAYGARLLAAIWPHLPFEFVAFTLAGGGYLAARRGLLTGRALTCTWTAIGLLLVAGGLAEATISNPR